LRSLKFAPRKQREKQGNKERKGQIEKEKKREKERREPVYKGFTK